MKRHFTRGDRILTALQFLFTRGDGIGEGPVDPTYLLGSAVYFIDLCVFNDLFQLQNGMIEWF